jgi:formylglycine-generating enzyme required for sulfatase activity
MHGNVWEWLQDRYDAAYYASSPSTDPTGPTTGNFRVLRSGGFYDSLKDARSAARMYNGVDYRYNILGVRLALTR